jgi:uncharacterized damage-inducible protein DinB
MTRAALIALHRSTHECLDVILRHAASLPGGLFVAEVPGFGKASLRDQFVHTLSAESAWICGVRRQALVRLDAGNYPDVNSVAQAKHRVMAITRAWLDEVSEEELGREIAPLPPEWVGPPRTPAFIVLHIVTHAFHHKGQMAAMFRLLGHPAPDTDLQRE